MRIFLFIFVFSLASFALQPNVAVLNFKGDQTVTAAQLDFITGKFASELLATQSFRVLERGQMDQILREQGFQQSGACDAGECQVQMGQMLGVDKLISGHMVQFGSEYAFRLQYIDVVSGAIEKTVELTATGELQDVYKAVCKEGAKRLATWINKDAKAPTKVVEPKSEAPVVPADAIPKAAPSRPLSGKRKIALALWGTSLAGAGGGYYFNGQAVNHADDYDAAQASYLDPSVDRQAEALREGQDAYDNLQSAQTGRTVSYGVSAGAAVLGAVLWFWPEGGN